MSENVSHARAAFAFGTGSTVSRALLAGVAMADELGDDRATLPVAVAARAVAHDGCSALTPAPP